MSDAAKSARGSFDGIKSGAREMGSDVQNSMRGMGYSMGEARHGIMLLGEELGVHLPRGITAFLTTLGPVAGIMEAAFPFLAIAVGATLLIEHLVKVGEAAEKAAEAGRKLDDDMTLGLNKSKEAVIDAEIEIRKLAGLPAWDLLGEKLQLKDADKGIENINLLDKRLADLLKAHGATSNWNPFNWLDNSDDLANKAKALHESLQGKNSSEQIEILNSALTQQKKLLEDMKGDSSASNAQLHNQEAYVGLLKQGTQELQNQADAAVLADQATQGKDREKKQEDYQKELSNWETYLDNMNKGFESYIAKARALKAKQAQDTENEADLERRATESVLAEVKKQGEDRSRLDEQLGKETAQHGLKMAELAMAAGELQTKDEAKLKRSHSQEILDEELKAEDSLYQAKKRSYEVELGSLDKNGKDYELKLRQIQDREAERTKEHENKVTQIKSQAEQERNARILSANRHFEDEIASGMARTIMQHQSMASMFSSIGEQIATGMLQNALMIETTDGRVRLSSARTAASQAFKWGWEHGGPAAPILAPILGGLAFAAGMAFAEGGIVPGVGRGDTVPAMLTPGEAVLPKRMTEQLTHAAQHGGGEGGGKTVHVHYSPTQHFSAIDGAGVKSMLQDHADEFTAHVHNELRKRNM